MPASWHAGSHQSAWCGGGRAGAKGGPVPSMPSFSRIARAFSPSVTNARTFFGPPHFSQTNSADVRLHDDRLELGGGRIARVDLRGAQR